MKLRGNLGALLQLPEEGKKRGQCRSLLPGNQQKDSWEQLRAVPGEVQSKYQEKIFTMRVVKHWNKLPSKVVDAPWL